MDATDNRLEKKQTIVAKKGLIGLKNVLIKENPSYKSVKKEVKDLKGLKKVLENVLVTKLRVMKYKMLTLYRPLVG